MKLQLALDDITLEDALSLVRTVRDYIDIIEIGLRPGEKMFEEF